MSISHLVTPKGQTASGDLDFEWIVTNGDERLEPQTAKMLIASKGLKYIAAHGKKIRFQKRVEGEVIRIDVANCTAHGISEAAIVVEELLVLNKQQLIAEKIYRSPRGKAMSTFSFICEDYKKEEMDGLAASTIKGYKTCLNRLVRVFNQYSLHEITHQHVKTWVKNNIRSSGLSCKAMKDSLFMMRHVLSHSRNIGLKTVNVGTIDFESLRKYLARFDNSDKTIDNIECLSKQDFHKLDFNELKSEGLHVIRDAALLTATSVAGRSGEIRALAREDFSIDAHGNNKVTINRTAVLEQFKTPKCYNRNLSTIEVLDNSKIYISRLMEESQRYPSVDIDILLKNNATIRQTVNMLVVNPKTGRPYTEQQYRSEFYRLQRLAGIVNPVSPRQLRHTACKLADAAGIPMSVFFRQLTHVNDKSTEKFYCGVTRRNNPPEVVNAMNEKITTYLSTDNYKAAYFDNSFTQRSKTIYNSVQSWCAGVFANFKRPACRSNTVSTP